MYNCVGAWGVGGKACSSGRCVIQGGAWHTHTTHAEREGGTNLGQALEGGPFLLRISRGQVINIGRDEDGLVSGSLTSTSMV